MGVKKRIRREIERQRKQLEYVRAMNLCTNPNDPLRKEIVRRNATEICKISETIHMLNNILKG